MTSEGMKRRMSTPTMVLRSIVAVLLLFGSLLPAGGIVQTAAAIIAVPLVVGALARPLVERLYLHDAFLIVIPVFAGLLIPALFLPTVGDYGSDKLLDLGTLSLFTALAASMINSPEHLRIFARTWAVFGILVAAVTLTGDTGIAERAVGAGANPIGLARAMATAVIAVVWLMLNQRLRTVPGILTIAVTSLGIFATGSKGPVLGAGIACVFMILSLSNRRTTRIIQMVTASAAAYVVVLVVPILRESRLGKFLLDPLGVQDSVRSGALDATAIALQAQGFWGHGYGSWPYITQVRVMEYPHNIWAELVIEAGLLPVIIVAAAFIVVLFRLLRTHSTSAQLAAAWLAAETVAASLSGDIRARVFWFFLVLGYLVVRWGRETQTDSSGGGEVHHGSERNERGGPEGKDSSTVSHGTSHRGERRVSTRSGGAGRRRHEQPVGR